jgi:hypothetical protein
MRRRLLCVLLCGCLLPLAGCTVADALLGAGIGGAAGGGRGALVGAAIGGGTGLLADMALSQVHPVVPQIATPPPAPPVTYLVSSPPPPPVVTYVVPAYPPVQYYVEPVEPFFFAPVPRWYGFPRWRRGR